MLSMAVDVEEIPQGLSFQALFSKFARRYRSCYIKYDCSNSYNNPYNELLANGFLLGLDSELITRKKALRDEQDGLKKTEKTLKKDPTFRAYYCGQGDPQLDVDELEFSIGNLEKELAEFKVSSNYHEIEAKANSVSFEKKALENNRAVIENNIKNITAALEIQADASVDRVVQLYTEATVELSEMVKKELREVEAFHQSLISKRDARLRGELKKNEAELRSVTQEIENAGKEMDQLLGYLDTHGALEEYTALNKQLTDLRLRLNHIKEYQNMLKAFQTRLNELKDECVIESRKTDKYIETSESLLKTIRQTYFEMAKTFYPKKKSGLIIENNIGENQLRFNIEARIEDDSSDGVNEVKIFCFDMLLLLQGISGFEFILHDSRLLANMDPRQRTTLYRVAFDICKDHNFQYITSINEDTLKTIQALMDEDEYTSIVEKNVILSLNDDSPSSKLLGLQVDVDLEE